MEENKKLTVHSLMQMKTVEDRIKKLQGINAETFTAAVLQLSNTLGECEPRSLLNACITSATLDLSINPVLGEAYVISYKTKGGNIAQFQIGWKGFVKMALKTQQYKKINCIPVYQNQFIKWDSLSETLEGDFSLVGTDKIVGYAAYFRLINGFEKFEYWSMERVVEHAKKYSQTYGKKYSNGDLIKSPWNDETQFDAMAMKTLIKSILVKWGPKSSKLERAIEADQSAQIVEGEFEYVDNENVDENGNSTIEISSIEVLKQINESKDLFELEEVYKENKHIITKDVHLVSAVGKMKKQFSNE